MIKKEIIMQTVLRKHIEIEQQITLPKDVIISDPCYDLDTWCMIHITHMKPGLYNIDFWKAHDPWDGHRFIITHVDYKRNVIPKSESKETLGIDAGMVGVYPLHEFKNNDIVLEEYYDSNKKWYKAQGPIDTYNLFANGFISKSGYGDGTARLYYDENANGEVIRIAVLF
jgi:hypothetical protein